MFAEVKIIFHMNNIHMKIKFDIAEELA